MQTQTDSHLLPETAPFVPWHELAGYLKTEFRQGDHVTIIGPTGGGKTHIAIELAEFRTYSIFLACKPKDPLISALQSRGYHLLTKMEVPYVDGTPHWRRVIYWPRFSERQTKGDLVREKGLQSKAVKQAFSYVRRQGSWALIVDEGTWVCRDLKLQRDVDSILFQGRTLNVSIIILTQRPAWVGQYALSQATHLFLFQTSHGDDLKKLGEISGVDTRLVRELVTDLDTQRHEVLYVNARTRDMFRTIAPARSG